jgi:hypothetical protein
VAGYSETSLATKLGIKEGATLALLNAPPGLIAELPAGVVVKDHARGHADIVVAFFTERAELERRLRVFEKMIFPNGALWIVWPKRVSRVETNITDDVVREVALPRGLVDTKVCAVDETWSGLRFVWRRERRMVAGC